jgi:hypothetical protein
MEHTAMRRLVYCFLFASLLGGHAVAEQMPAALEVISGPVYVDQGEGLVKADDFTLLNSDDRILMKVGSTALLTNNKLGCTISLRDAGLYRVPDMTNCNAGQAKVMQSDITITPANGIFVPAQPSQAGFVVGGGGGSGSVMAGLGFFGLVGLTVVTNAIFEESPVESPVSSP